MTASRTGRTTALVESLTNGDCVVCLSDRNARDIQRLSSLRNITVNTMVTPQYDPAAARKLGGQQRRVIFDHAWLEAFYLDAIEHAERTIERIEQDASGDRTSPKRSNEAERLTFIARSIMR